MGVMRELASHSRLSQKMKDLTVEMKERSFVEALNEKYVDQDEIKDQITVPKDKFISTEITFVGFGKVTSVQRQLRRLASIDVSGRNITSAGDLSSVKGSLDRVLILNLADNHLAWNEIIKILSCLPSLRELIITGNDLQAIENIKLSPEPHRRLKSLVMGRVKLSWQSTVEVTSRIWSNIDQIDLWDNSLTVDKVKISDCYKDSAFIKQITSLTMSQNMFLDLTWIPEMGHLVSLTELDISSCQLECISIEDPIARGLDRLRTLNIAHNNIKDWRSMSNLNRLPNLTSLVCNDNPFFATEKLARSLVVAQMARLKILNREHITNTFRRDSEITLIRKVFPVYQDFKEGINDELDQVYPRYKELIEEYGLPEDLIAKPLDDKYIIVELCHEDKQIAKKLPCDMRVSNLQMLCKRLFKIRPSNSIEIVCCVAGSPEKGISYTLDQEGQTLHFFSVKTNNRLLIKER